MTDLIFHIGLSKCASSTLQQSVFCNEEGYLGTKVDHDRNLASQLLQYGPFMGRQTIDRKGLRVWGGRLKKIHAETWPDAKRLIMSQEILSSASKLSDRPILQLLSLIKNDIWTKGRIRVVVVFRNQASWLASSYVQSSNSYPNAGQAHFEDYVHRYLKSARHRRLLDFSAWLSGLQSLVGNDNVCPLLLEDAVSIGFWEKIADFCSLSNFQPETMVANSNERNKRRSSEDTWATQPYDPEFRARVGVEKCLNLVWPRTALPGLRSNLRDGLIRVKRIRLERQASHASGSLRDPTIQISEKIICEVRKSFGQSNKRLSLMLQRDLKPLGY